jgi:hypothetical protein
MGVSTNNIFRSSTYSDNIDSATITQAPLNLPMAFKLFKRLHKDGIFFEI